MTDDAKEAKTALNATGEINGEFVAFGTWRAPHDGLEDVHVAYVPLTSTRLQDLTGKLETASRRQAMRLSVEVIKSQARAWDGKTIKGEPADCRNARQMADEMDYNAVEGVCGVIMDSRRCAEAREALENFPER